MFTAKASEQTVYGPTPRSAKKGPAELQLRQPAMAQRRLNRSGGVHVPKYVTLYLRRRLHCK